MKIMTSWRDSASQQEQDALDDLLNAALPLAEQMLQRHGEFYPFGASISEEGETQFYMGDPNEREFPESQAVIDVLVEGFRDRRDSLNAIALVSDVRLVGSDAIRVELEHRAGHSMAAFLPYTKKRLRKGVEFGAMSASSNDPQVWTTS